MTTLSPADAAALREGLREETRDGRLDTQELADYLFWDRDVNPELRNHAGYAVTRQMIDQRYTPAQRLERARESAREICDALVSSHVIRSYDEAFVSDLVRRLPVVSRSGMPAAYYPH